MRSSTYSCPKMLTAALSFGMLAMILLGCGQRSAESPGDSIHSWRGPDLTSADDAGQSLWVSAVHDDNSIQVRFVFETDNPIWYHQYWVYEGGEWVRYGSGSEGPDEHGLYEDRISMMIDDGSVPYFAQAGGYVTVHHGVRSLPSEIGSEEVEAHPYLGEELGESDVRKFIEASRTEGPSEESWSWVRSEDELRQLREEGIFLDTWQWRAHRSNPIGYADNGYVLDYRHSSEGTGPYTTNWKDSTDAPAWMFAEAITGHRALRFESLKAREYGQDDYYYLTEAHAVPFDPDHDWQEGDALPQRFLREPSGSRGAIRASGRYEQGAWRVSMTRSLESPNPLDSKTLRPGETYSVAFAVHTGGVGARHHLVTVPVKLTLGEAVDGGISVTHVGNGSLDAANGEWTEIPLFLPGTATWDQLRENFTE